MGARFQLLLFIRYVTIATYMCIIDREKRDCLRVINSYHRKAIGGNSIIWIYDREPMIATLAN